MAVTVVSLLLWAEKGRRTLDEAAKTGRSASEAWRECDDRGYLAKGADNRVVLTEAGVERLYEERMGT